MDASQLTVFTAKKIITMERDLPQATAVGVVNGRIAGVGTLEDLRPWLDAHPHTIDEQFADKILMPGFIDPHVHPFLPAVLTQMPFVAPDAWRLPTGDFPAVLGESDFIAAVRRRHAEHDPASGPFFVWGFHPMFHGDVFRRVIDREISADQPVLLWHRSFHELILNSAALAWAGIASLDDVPELARSGVDLERGRFAESGLAAIFGRIYPLFFAPERLQGGLATFGEMVHAAGVTTAADMGTGLMAPMLTEAAAIRQAFERDGVPFRVQLTAIESSYISANRKPEDALSEVRAEIEKGGHRVTMRKHFKLLIDGAFFSQAFQCCAPGYIDGHEGAWVVPREATQQFARTFWDAGFQLHAHCNGDGGARFTLDLLNDLLDETPRFDHRFTMEHWGYATVEQDRRLAVLGAVVSGQPWYTHVLGDKYAEIGLGADRAHQMSRFGSLVAEGVPVALHSDCTMAPLEPLRLAWSAATRQTVAGNVLTPSECLTLEQALRAITVDAAWCLRWEDEIGSIRTGKKADFAVLGADPYEVGVSGLPDIPIWGTVFEGAPAPIR